MSETILLNGGPHAARLGGSIQAPGPNPDLRFCRGGILEMKQSNRKGKDQ